MAQARTSEIATLETSVEGLVLRSPSQHRLVRWGLMALGSVLVAVGVVGIFVPLLPSMIFFLMALGCYGKSSPSAYAWMTTNRLFGQHLREYREGKGATIPAKTMSIVSIWIGIGLSVYLIDNLLVTVILGVIAATVSLHLVRLPTVRR